MRLDEKWQSYYEKILKNYYYHKNYFIFKLPCFRLFSSIYFRNFVNFLGLINFCSGMKTKILHIFVTKFPGGKMQFCPRNFTNIAEINRKTHWICRKRTRKFLLGYDRAFNLKAIFIIQLFFFFDSCYNFKITRLLNILNLLTMKCINRFFFFPSLNRENKIKKTWLKYPFVTYKSNF